MSSIPLSADTNQDDTFLSYLISSKRIQTFAIDRLRRVQRETGDKLSAVLLKLGLLSEADLVLEFSVFSGVKPLTFESFPAEALVHGGLNADFLRTHEVLPLRQDDGELRIVCWDILDDYPVRALEFATGLRVHRSVAGKTMRGAGMNR